MKFTKKSLRTISLLSILGCSLMGTAQANDIQTVAQYEKQEAGLLKQLIASETAALALAQKQLDMAVAKNNCQDVKKWAIAVGDMSNDLRQAKALLIEEEHDIAAGRP